MKNKNASSIILLTLLLIIPSVSNAQKEYFEGIIKYAVSFNSESISNQDLIDYYGDTAIVYIKAGKYKIVYPNATVMQTIYNDEKNLYYTQIKGLDSLLYIEANNAVTKYKVSASEKSDTTIFGYHCSYIQVISKENSISLYFAQDLPLMYKRFKKHKIGGYNKIIRKTKSTYLIAITSNKYFTSTSVAISIEWKKLDDSIFETPDLPLKHR
jgi:hypothetical protein